MPSNLNALLRYKTIDKCLNNLYRKCTIDYLIDKCCDSLSEAKGEPTSVSERTIRNDIKVMRSNLLGFNAPIVFENDEYRYSEENYSVFDIRFHDLDLLIQVQNILVGEIDNISASNKISLIRKLSEITKQELPDKYRPIEDNDDNDMLSKKYHSNTPYDFYPNKRKIKKHWLTGKKKIIPLEQVEYFNWKFIFDVL